MEGENNACNNYIITLIENIIILEIIPLIEVKEKLWQKVSVWKTNVFNLKIQTLSDICDRKKKDN